MSSPSKTIRPAAGRSTPVRQLKNVDFPAPFGPMIARISPAWTAMETLFKAASPPKRTVRPSVRRMGAPPRPSAGAAVLSETVTLGELAGGRNDRLLLRHDRHDLVLAAAELVEELPKERLVVLLAEELVPLREVVALLHLQALERLDELHRVLAPAEARLLHADLEGVYALEVRLHVAVRRRAARVDGLEPGQGVVEEPLVVRRVQYALQHRHVAVDAHEALALGADRRQAGGHRHRPVAGEPVLLREPEVEALGDEGDALRAEEDPEQPVEVAADLREERGHVGGAERDSRGPHHLAAVLLDRLHEGVLGGLAPRVVGVGDVPLLAHLADHVRPRRDRLGRREVERPEGVPAALARRDRRVETHGDHVDDLVRLVERHAGETDVGQG